MKKTFRALGIVLVLAFVGFGVNYVSAQITNTQSASIETVEKEKEKDKDKKKKKEKRKAKKKGGCCHGSSGSCTK